MNVIINEKRAEEDYHIVLTTKCVLCNSKEATPKCSQNDNRDFDCVTPKTIRV